MKKHGDVIWFEEIKGFGFLRDEEGRDVFVHYSEILRDGFRTLHVGEKVLFDLVDDEGGLKARQVEIVETQNQDAKPS